MLILLQSGHSIDTVQNISRTIIFLMHLLTLNLIVSYDDVKMISLLY